MLYSPLMAAKCERDASSSSSPPYAPMVIILKFLIKKKVNCIWSDDLIWYFSKTRFAINSMLNSLVDCYIVIINWSMLYSPLMAANWEQMLHPLPTHTYSHNSVYCYISYHIPTTCKSLECLGFESQRWIVVYFSSCQHHPRFTSSPFMGNIFFLHILSLIFPTTSPATSLFCHSPTSVLCIPNSA